MIKVGLVIGQLGFGGAEKQAVLLAQGLKNIGQYEPIIFCLSRNIEPYGGILSAKGLAWLAIPEGMKNPMEKVAWLARQARLANCSLLYGFLNVGNVYAATVGIFNQVPFVCSIRNADSRLPYWLRVLSGWSCSFADYTIANSLSCVRSLRDDLKVRHKRVAVIKNALDFQHGADGAGEKIKAEWGIPQGALVIGTVANLKRQKNPLFFIKIFKALIRLPEETQFYFLWIGDGPQLTQVEDAITKLSPDIKNRIIFPGARHDIPNVLKAFDIFILTSSFEGLPNALLEAMAAGLPCAATRVAGTIDVVEGLEDDNLLAWALPNDHSDFVTVLRRLMGNEAYRIQMGERAQAYVTQAYSVERMTQEHTKLFQEVLSKRCKS